MVDVKVKKLDPNAKVPVKSTVEAAGLDFFALENGAIYPNELEKVKTGIALSIPKDYWGDARARSGIATKHKILLCSSGVIDSDYRGEVMFPLLNQSDQVFRYKAGDKIGQMVIVPTPPINLEEVEELDESQRGTGGFGSTGH